VIHLHEALEASVLYNAAVGNENTIHDTIVMLGLQKTCDRPTSDSSYNTIIHSTGGYFPTSRERLMENSYPERPCSSPSSTKTTTGVPTQRSAIRFLNPKSRHFMSWGCAALVIKWVRGGSHQRQHCGMWIFPLASGDHFDTLVIMDEEREAHMQRRHAR
jgi:hypothetical protein